MNMPEERERVYDVLTKINNTDSITFEKFQEIIKTAEAADVTSMWDSSFILLSAPNYCNFQGAPDSHIFRGDGEREEDRALAAAYLHPNHYNCPVCSLLCQLKHERISSREIPPIWHVRNHQKIYIICKVTFGLIWKKWVQPKIVSWLITWRDCIVQTWWSYLTYSLLHVGEGHLIFNLVLQLGIGLGLEMVHGSVSVLLLYTLGVRSHFYRITNYSPPIQVLAGSLSFFCFDCGSLLGASGGKIKTRILIMWKCYCYNNYNITIYQLKPNVFCLFILLFVYIEGRSIPKCTPKSNFATRKTWR